MREMLPIFVRGKLKPKKKVWHSKIHETLKKEEKKKKSNNKCQTKEEEEGIKIITIFFPPNVLI